MNHTFRGVLSAWMVLIVLRTVGTSGGSGKVASLFGDIDNLVQRALSPDVPAIADRRIAGGTPTTAGGLPLAARFDQYSSQHAPTLGRNVPS